MIAHNDTSIISKVLICYGCLMLMLVCVAQQSVYYLNCFVLIKLVMVDWCCQKCNKPFSTSSSFNLASQSFIGVRNGIIDGWTDQGCFLNALSNSILDRFTLFPGDIKTDGAFFFCSSFVVTMLVKSNFILFPFVCLLMLLLKG
jgi:hypothetical protein